MGFSNLKRSPKKICSYPGYRARRTGSENLPKSLMSKNILKKNFMNRSKEHVFMFFFFFLTVIKR